MSSKRAALVINPRTGQNLAKITDVLAVLSAAGWKTTIAIKEYGGHSMELANKATKANSDLVIAYGGDGTLNQVVNGVMNTRGQHSVVGVIPGGTANVWAGEIGIPIDPVKAALSLANSEARKVDIGHVEVQGLTLPSQDEEQQTQGKKQRRKIKASRSSDKAKHHFLLMAGLGIDAAIMGNVSKPLKYRIGPLAVGLSAAKEIPEHRAFPIEIWTTYDGHNDEFLWKGEALQVVIGNTRRYGDIAEMTPDAYIDDGVLNVCVIVGGDPLTTMQQIASLLLRRKPDNLTAEYFHGAHLCISVPASVPMQLDGSAVRLKDYLSKSEYDTLQQVGDAQYVMVNYQFDAMPHALEVAIPRTYNDALFEHSASAHQGTVHSTSVLHTHHEKAHVQTHHRKDDENPQTELQQHTEEEESRPVSQSQHTEDERQHDKHAEEVRKELPELVGALLEQGRKVTVVGKAPLANKKQTYIIAGGTPKPGTGEIKPVAVVVNGETTIFDRHGEQVSSDVVRELQEGAVIIVEGDKSKRGVIQATRAVIV